MYLAVVKGTRDGEVVDICVEDSRHLGLLDGAHAALGVQDEDGDILLAAKAVDGSRARVTAGCAHDGEMMAI